MKSRELQNLGIPKGEPVRLAAKAIARARFEQRAAPAPCRRWGTDIEAQALQQMDNACKLPVSVAGALMPDAHTGYGLPIGGVLATKDVVIPYAVGMDIANFAWKENHFGQDVIVHRKGATPAGKGVVGIIPGSMATPGYVVRGKGVAASMNSASHGAGRRMSRTATKNT